MPTKKKKFNARFPPARIKKIMQKDDEIGKVAAPVPVIISRALELFVESLVLKTSFITKSRNAKTLTSSHLKSCVLSDDSFNFLRELVAAVPDVQGDEDTGTSATYMRNIEIPPRQKRSQDKRSSEDGAGPSHSTADESETWSAEDDDEEDSDTSSTESPSHQPLVLSIPSTPSSPVTNNNAAFEKGSFYSYVSCPVPSASSTNSANNGDDDYDS